MDTLPTTELETLQAILLLLRLSFGVGCFLFVARVFVFLLAFGSSRREGSRNDC